VLCQPNGLLRYSESITNYEIIFRFINQIITYMNNYFEDMLPADELAQLKYIPTIPEFVTWIEEKWEDLPALSDTVNTYT